MKTSDTFIKNINSTKRIVVNRGGSSSSKTFSILQMLFKWLKSWELRKNEYIPSGVATIGRQYGAELSKSVLRDWQNILSAENMILSSRLSGWKYIKENKSERTYSYHGRVVEFIGCDDTEKVKGPRRQILYLNEANNIQYNVFKQLLMRTSNACFIDFNPDDDEVWINTKLEQERASKIGDVEVIVSTFRDNAFLPRSIVDELLNLRITDPDLWQVYGNWKYWKIKGAIFEEGKHWQVIDEVPEEAILKGYGQDYGFFPDPTVLVWVYQYWKDGIILDEVFRENNLINTYKDDSEKLSSIQGQYELYEIDEYIEIWADSSEPKSNEDLSGAGYNVNGVKKGPWSIISGIKTMKKYKLYITARSVGLRREFKKYVWATNKTSGETLKDKEGRPIPLDKYNHGIDASRYWITHLFDTEQNLDELSLSIL